MNAPDRDAEIQRLLAESAKFARRAGIAARISLGLALLGMALAITSLVIRAMG